MQFTPRPPFKIQITLLGMALTLMVLAACGGTSSTAPVANAASPAPNSAGTPPSGSSSGSSGSGAGSGSSSGGTGSAGSTSGGSGSGGSAGGGSSQAAVAYAYVGTVNRSTAGVYGFSITPDGSATLIPGSPAAGPSSYVVTNSAFVFASDTENIASYVRRSDGSLQQSSLTHAVLSNGTEPWALESLGLDHSGQTLYASENAGSDDLYYFFFGIAADGKVTSTGKIGPSVNYGSALVFSPDNNYAYGEGCFHLGWEITAFRRNSDGTLSPLTFNNPGGIPAYSGPSQNYCPQGEAISQAGYLAVADTALNTNTSGIGVYKINSDGSLSFIGNSTLATQLSRVNGLSFDSSGQYLAVAGNAGIQMYQLTSAGTLTSIGGIQQPGSDFLAVQWDRDNHLYAISSAGLHIFVSSQGILAPAPGSPHGAGAARTLAVLSAH